MQVKVAGKGWFDESEIIFIDIIYQLYDMNQRSSVFLEFIYSDYSKKHIAYFIDKLEMTHVV